MTETNSSYLLRSCPYPVSYITERGRSSASSPSLSPYASTLNEVVLSTCSFLDLAHANHRMRRTYFDSAQVKYRMEGHTKKMIRHCSAEPEVATSSASRRIKDYNESPACRSPGTREQVLHHFRIQVWYLFGSLPSCWNWQSCYL